MAQQANSATGPAKRLPGGPRVPPRGQALFWRIRLLARAAERAGHPAIAISGRVDRFQQNADLSSSRWADVGSQVTGLSSHISVALPVTGQAIKTFCRIQAP